MKKYSYSFLMPLMEAQYLERRLYTRLLDKAKAILLDMGASHITEPRRKYLSDYQMVQYRVYGYAPDDHSSFTEHGL